MVLHERPETLRRRWTGIEPAGRGSLVPTALKAAEPTSTRTPPADTVAAVRYAATMKRLILLIAVIALVAAAVKKLQSS